MVQVSVVCHFDFGHFWTSSNPCSINEHGCHKNLTVQTKEFQKLSRRHSLQPWHTFHWPRWSGCCEEWQCSGWWKQHILCFATKCFLLQWLGDASEVVYKLLKIFITWKLRSSSKYTTWSLDWQMQKCLECDTSYRMHFPSRLLRAGFTLHDCNCQLPKLK